MPYNVPNNIKNIPSKLATLKAGNIQGVDANNPAVRKLRDDLSSSLGEGYNQISPKLDGMIANADTGNLINTPELQTPPVAVNGMVDFVTDEKSCGQAIDAMASAVDGIKQTFFTIVNGEANAGQGLWNVAIDYVKTQAKEQINAAFDAATEEMFAQFDEYLGKTNVIKENFNSASTDVGMQAAIANALSAQEGMSPGSTGGAQAGALAAQAKSIKSLDDIKGKKTSLHAEKQAGSLKVALINLAVEALFTYFFGQSISSTTGSIPGSATVIFEGLVGPYGNLVKDAGETLQQADMCKIAGRLGNLTDYLGNIQSGQKSIEDAMNQIDGVSPETASKIAKAASQQMKTGISTEGGADIVQKAADKISLDIYQAQKFTKKA